MYTDSENWPHSLQYMFASTRRVCGCLSLATGKGLERRESLFRTKDARKFLVVNLSVLVDVSLTNHLVSFLFGELIAN